MTQHITDGNGARYTLGPRLGSGGQGDVFQLKEGRLAVKLVRRDGRTDAEILRRRLERVKRLDLDGLPLARPLTVLRLPNLGYIMELLPGTRSLGTLIRPSSPMKSIAAWYGETGGLRGRLRVLAALARVMNQLHGRGVAYGDLSPDNVRVNGDPAGEFSLHLIDCDNLRVESSPDPAWLFTPGYAAPELLAARSGANTLSDLHAFAVVAFECLTCIHPFVGDVVADGEPELEERAFAGKLPWVEDAADRSNATTRGVPRNRVISEKTRQLFDRAFGSGRADPGLRSRFAEWVDVLEQAADMALHCANANCRASYFLEQLPATCPWCDEPVPHHLTMSFLLWDPSQEDTLRFGKLVQDPGRRLPKIIGSMRLTSGLPVNLERRHLGPVFGSAVEAAEPLVSLRYEHAKAGKLEGTEVACNLVWLPNRRTGIAATSGDSHGCDVPGRISRNGRTILPRDEMRARGRRCALLGLDVIKMEIGDWLVHFRGHNLEPLVRAIGNRTLVFVRAQPELSGRAGLVPMRMRALQPLPSVVVMSKRDLQDIGYSC